MERSNNIKEPTASSLFSPSRDVQLFDYFFPFLGGVCLHFPFAPRPTTRRKTVAFCDPVGERISSVYCPVLLKFFIVHTDLRMMTLGAFVQPG